MILGFLSGYEKGLVCSLNYVEENIWVGIEENDGFGLLVLGNRFCYFSLYLFQNKVNGYLLVLGRIFIFFFC